eukprot:GSChrysophyteH1.ASY1.ANO1.2527.1 assembled CDS
MSEGATVEHSDSIYSTREKKCAIQVPKGLSGRLTKGAGTHLASWLQEVTALTQGEAQGLLDEAVSISSNKRGIVPLNGLQDAHGKKAGHSKPISDVAYSGDVLITKDSSSMRLWRARGDYALLRVVTCRGPHVAFHPNGQFVVTGTRGSAPGQGGLKIWGPAGGGTQTAGKRKIVC